MAMGLYAREVEEEPEGLPVAQDVPERKGVVRVSRRYDPSPHSEASQDSGTVAGSGMPALTETMNRLIGRMAGRGTCHVEDRCGSRRRIDPRFARLRRDQAGHLPRR